MIEFESSSSVNDTQCVQFEPVNDMIVERNEIFTFLAQAQNPLDVFVEGSNSLTITVYDDDGITINSYC